MCMSYISIWIFHGCCVHHGAHIVTFTGKWQKCLKKNNFLIFLLSSILDCDHNNVKYDFILVNLHGQISLSCGTK